MLSDLTHSILGLFKLGNMLAFIAGVLATLFTFWTADRWRDYKEPELRPHRTKFKSLVLLWMMVYIVVGYIAVQEQQQADCTAQILDVGQKRQEAGEKTDDWSLVKTKAMNDWLRDVIVFPPPEMLERRTKNPNDPVYLNWAIRLTTKYSTIIDQAQQEQEAAIEERKRHPLPEPNCGRINR
jgi:hypothetical protein